MRRLLMALALLCAAAPAAAQGGEVIHFYHTDALGSVRAVTDMQGNVVRRHDYLPFAEEPSHDAGHGQRGFAGKDRDAETQLDYFAARFYLPRTGRFTTSDPDHVGGNIYDPQSWKEYAYARNNPVRFIDPTGTDFIVAMDGYDAVRYPNDNDYSKLVSRPGDGFRIVGGGPLCGAGDAD